MTLDAKRIAEIRGLVAAGWREAAEDDLIALCDLAERGLAMERVVSELAAPWMKKLMFDHLAEILASSTNERKG